MQAIFLRELKHYLTSMIGYIYIAAFLLISGYLFASGNLLSQNGDLKSFFAALSPVVIFLVPILTMRLFSEERRMRTLQLLFSMPVSLGGIVTGKFLATICVFFIGLIPSFSYPIILGAYGSVELMVVLGNYSGLLLLVCAATSIGLFISALSENQIIAAVVSYAALLLLWLSDSLGNRIDAGPISRALSLLSLNSHFREFSFGIFNPANILFYLSISMLFLFFTIIILDRRKSS